MSTDQQSFLENHIENFIAGKLKNISYDQEFLTSKISDSFINFYIDYFGVYYSIIVIAILVYGISLLIQVNMKNGSSFNLSAHLIKTFFITIFFFAFPFLFSFIITICNLMADRVMPTNEGMQFYDLMFGLDSYFNELMSSQPTIDAIEDQTNNQTDFIDKLKNIAIEAKTFVGEIKFEPQLWVKTAATVGASIFAWISYTSLLIVRFLGLSLLFVLAPILVPLSLFGMWGNQLFDKYIKTVINLSFWVVIKSVLDRVFYEYMLNFNDNKYIDDLSYMAMIFSYSVMVITIPFISSYFIGGLNLSPTVAGSAWLRSKSMGLFQKAGGGALNIGKEKGAAGLNKLKDSLLMKNKTVSDGINSKTIRVPKFSLGGKK